MMFKNKLFVFVLLVTAGLTACKKDDDKVQNTTQLPANEAKVVSQKMDADLSKDIIDMFNAEGINAVYSLSDLLISDDIFSQAKTKKGSSPKALLKSKGRDFRKIFVPQNSISNGKLTDHEPFDFQGKLGVYEWNAATESFDKTDAVSNSIIINFPLENSSTNNVSFILSNYSEVKIIETTEYYSDEYYVPTKIVAEVKIDNVKKAGLNYDVAYSSKGNPTSASIDLLVTPFTYTLVYSSTGAKSSKIITSIKKGTELLFDTAYNLTFSDTEKNDLSEVNGYSAYKEYKIQGSINVTELNKLDDDGDINPFVKLELFKNTAKVGDIVFVNVKITDDYYSYTDRVAYVKYADDSKEKVETIFASTIEEWENYLMELERG